MWTQVSVLERSDKAVLTIVDVVQVCFSTRNVLNPNFHKSRGCAMFEDCCFSVGKIQLSHCHCRGSPVEAVQSCFGTRNVLKFSFDKCRGYARPVSVLGTSDKAVFTIVEVVQASFSIRNILKPNFHNCRCYATLVDSCISTGKKR